MAGDSTVLRPGLDNRCRIMSMAIGLRLGELRLEVGADKCSKQESHEGLPN